MTDAVKRLINIAKGEVGYLEKASNSNLDSPTANAGYANWNKYARDIDQKYPDFYNGKKNGYAWCDCFTDWCFITAFGRELGQKLLCQPNKSSGAGCTESARYYQRQGRLFYSNPQPGDQVFFGSDGYYGHTGIVVDVDDRYVYTVEGNTSGAAGVVANGGGVFAKKYTKTTSLAYGRPDYSIVDDVSKLPDVPANVTPVAPVTPSVTEFEIEMTTLKLGSKGQQVKSMQILLIGSGYSCGGAGADGDFGNGTLAALKKFQKLNKLTSDGICGAATWNVLLKG